MVEILQNDPSIALAYADSAVTLVENSSFQDALVHAHLLWPEYNPKLLFGICFVGSQPLWRRSVHEKYGLFDDSYASAGDYHFWLKMAANGEKFYHVPEILGLNLQSDQCMEHRIKKLYSKESLKAKKQFRPPKPGRLPKHKGTYLVSVPPFINTPPVRISPLVSVIIPTCNRNNFLVTAVKSVLNQTMQNFEIIVINDGAEDVRMALEPLGNHEKIRIINNQCNKGRSYSRNAGIKAANGKYISYLDDDDIYCRDHLQTITRFLESTRFQVAYTDAYFAVQELKDGEYTSISKKVLYSNDFSKRTILWRNLFPPLCLVHEKSCCKKAGFFDETLDTHEDWDLIIRLSRHFEIRHIKKATTEYSMRNDGTSTTGSQHVDFLRTRIILYKRYAEFSRKDSRVRRKQKKSIRDNTKRLLGLGYSRKEIKECINAID